MVGPTICESLRDKHGKHHTGEEIKWYIHLLLILLSDLSYHLPKSS